MNQIHLKIENNDARGLKKELLLLEAGILNSTRKIKDFKKTRKIEFTTKNKIRAAFKDMNNEINKIKGMMPELERTKIIRRIMKGREEEKPVEAEAIKIRGKGKKRVIEKGRKMDTIERQLEEIRDKLAALG